MRLSLGLLLAGILNPTAISAMAQEAVLHGTIKDETTGAPSPCNVALFDARGNLMVESDSFKSGFRCSGEFTKRLPAGRTRIRVTRGFETQFVEKEIELEAGRDAEVGFILR